MLSTTNENIPPPGSLPVISQEELNVALEKHLMFLRGQIGGQRLIMQYKDLSNLNFHNRDISQSDFTGSMLVGTDLSLCIMKSSCFFGCDLRDSDISHADLSRTDLRGTSLSGANMSGANLADSDMREGKIVQKANTGDLVDRVRSGGAGGSKTLLVGARLTNADLSGVRARNADFSDADLSNSITHDADLDEATFHGANLSNADFSGSNLRQVNMQQAILSGVVMENVESYGLDRSGAITQEYTGKRIEDDGQTLTELLEEHTLWVKSAGKQGKQMNLSGYDLRDQEDIRHYSLTAIKAVKASFIDLDLRKASIQSSMLDKSDFRDCFMEHVDLRGSSLRNTKMTRANLSNARLSPLRFENADGSHRIQRVDLSGADLRFSNLQDIDLRDAILMGVDLTHADLSGADLRRADLTGSIIKGAKFDDAKLTKAIIDFDAI